MFTVDGNTITPDEVAEYLPDLDVDMFVDAMYKYMGSRFEGAAAGMTETYAGISGIMQSYQEDLDAAMAQGFMDARTAGMNEQVDWMSGESGDQIQEANRMIGEWQASLENEKERLLREYMEAAMGSEGYQQALAESNGAEAGRILAQAQIDAQAAYNASEGAQQLKDMQISLIEQTGKTLAADERTWNAGFLVGEAYSKGMLAAFEQAVPSLTPNAYGGTYYGGPATNPENYMTESPGFTGTYYGGPATNPANYASRYTGNAWGIPYVPYDNYVTRLHEGERVLTASEARSLDSGGTSSLPPITGNNFYIREEQDIYKIAQALVTELVKARMIT